jgi:hypothetical protein
MLWCCEDAPHDHKNKKEFDCVQRAHQNTLENLPIVVFSALLSGLKYPLYAGAFLTIWNIGRVIYARGFVHRHHLPCTTAHRHHPTPTNTPFTIVQRWAPLSVLGPCQSTRMPLGSPTNKHYHFSLSHTRT